MADEPHIPKVNYPGNSNRKSEEKKPEERKHLDPVISGEAIIRKKPWYRRLGDAMTSEDARTVGSYVLQDVFVPTLRNLIVDMISQGADRLFNGDPHARNVSRNVIRGAYTAYNRVYSGSSRYEQSPPARRELSDYARRTSNFDEIVLKTRGEAEDVLDHLYYQVQNYDVATVADLLDFVNRRGSFTDEKWGWTSMAGSSVQRVREGYLLNLPRVQPLD